MESRISYFCVVHIFNVVIITGGLQEPHSEPLDWCKLLQGNENTDAQNRLINKSMKGTYSQIINQSIRPSLSQLFIKASD